MAKKKATRKTQRRARGGAGEGQVPETPVFPMTITLGNGMELTIEGPSDRGPGGSDEL